MRPVLKKLLIILPIIALGLFLRVYEKAPSSLWTDEFATYWISSAPTISECISRAAPTQGQSPFYYVLEWFVLKILPHNENVLRLLSLFSSLISIYILYEIAILIFNSQSNNSQKNMDSGSSKKVLPAIFATLLFALDINQIYYSQEARPYAISLMFALLSQWCFIKLLRQKTKTVAVCYIIFSAFVIYSHYIFGTIILFQNIWVLLLLLRGKKDKSGNRIDLKSWCLWQISIIVLLIPLLFHLLPVIRQSSKWKWLKSGGLLDTFFIFGSLFNLRIILVFLGVFFMLLISEFIKSGKRPVLPPKQQLKKLQFLIIWLITPPLFAFFATLLMKTSLLDARYMVISLIPFYLISALCVDLLKHRNVKIFLMSFIIFAYIGGVLVPALKKEGRFCYRISHNWRDAISILNQHLEQDDVIVMRSGYIKENWLPTAKDPIIMEYVKAPLSSWYFQPVIYQTPLKPKVSKNFVNIFNMTYTKETDFYPYYNSIFDFCENQKRVWMIGVNPPNTNYLMSQVPEIMRNSHKKVFEKDFSGVYLVLLVKRPDVYRMFQNQEIK